MNKKLILEVILWGLLTVTAFGASTYANSGGFIGGKCWASSFCDCTMISHFSYRWCGGTSIPPSSYCYNSNHWCSWGSGLTYSEK